MEYLLPILSALNGRSEGLKVSLGKIPTVAWWITTRLASIILLFLAERETGSVKYYWRQLKALPRVGFSNTLTEYPGPVVWILAVPRVLAGSSRARYVIAFIAFMLVVDALFTWALWRSNGQRRDAGINFWLVFVPLMGPLAYQRFDLLPTVVVGGALLAARTRPGLAGALLGFGAAVKLWPALIAAGFAADRPRRLRLALGFCLVGIGLALATLLTGGYRRLVSPLAWQAGRGLQIESVWATPLMIARVIEPQRWSVKMSRFQAWEIFGPGVSVLVVLSTLATVAGLLAIVILWVRSYRNRAPSVISIGLVCLAAVAIEIVTNKTLSPQYILWLGGGAAALLTIAGRGDSGDYRPVRLTALILVLAASTQLVYPLIYPGLLGRGSNTFLAVATLVTAVRNITLVLFTVAVWVAAWNALRRYGDGSDGSSHSTEG